ncbi:hypothetical protein ACFXO7_34710, partial [Nocardia tengchongensis]
MDDEAALSSWDETPNPAESGPPPGFEPADAAALDAYSRTVIAVAASVTPHVASVQTRRGGGSEVVFNGDGCLL